MKLLNNVNQFLKAINDAVGAANEIANSKVNFDIEFKEDKDYNKQNGKITVNFGDDKLVGLVFDNEGKPTIVYTSEVEFSYLYSTHELGNKAALSMRITSEFGSTWQERISVGLGNPTLHAKMKALHDVVTNAIVADLTSDGDFDYVRPIQAALSI